ncbi:hypothetical protein RxyAA322_18320 [Rubrobacter xylanophilus]|uniref:Uncharacterized protein n=1 Tax=Rubrobacter xylanophilus TaxID=49319 RepID=A0A510HJ94_9ACTN|nr:hypothetical protein [Rubrobacter xylanophilus]BBL79978.1 hypothetical protein RxyAA322_18320 [Rubrobacter xylanophilus]
MSYLEGYLRARENGDEAEHTGYVFELEVDMSAVENADELVGEQLAITGDVEMVDLPNRGKILVFKVTSAATIEEEPEENGTSNE